jgi:hypothetical protein
MPRTTIRQFRDRLAARGVQDSDAQAYREIARRPELMHGMMLREWAPWPPIAAPQMAA